MIGQSVQSRTRTSLISTSRSDESMRTTDIDQLRSGVESFTGLRGRNGLDGGGSFEVFVGSSWSVHEGVGESGGDEGNDGEER